MRYIIINDINQILICYLESQSHLSPDERQEFEIIDQYIDGDDGFIPFMTKLSKYINFDNLDMDDYKAMLKIYRKS